MSIRLLLVAVFAAAAAWVFPVVMRPPKLPTPIPGARYNMFPMLGAAIDSPRPFAAPDVVNREKRHPFMAPAGVATIHADGASSDVHARGPLGRNLQVVSRVGSKYPGGMCATLTFDRDGLLIALCASLAGFELHLMAPRTLELLATYTLPQRPSTFAAMVTLDPERIMLDTSGGAYYYLDHEDRVVLADAAQHVQRIAHKRDPTDGSYHFYNDGDWDVSEHVPHDCLNWDNWFPEEGHCDPITAVTADFNGLIWWVTRRGIVGTVNPADGRVVTVNLSEEMQNGITVGSDGVYLVTTHALYCMEANVDGTPTQLWRESYDRGTFQKVGMLSQGSGTAPTLFDGKWATIADNSDDRINLIVYDRTINSSTAISGQLSGTGRAVCRTPLFESGASASDNSMIAVGSSIFMENNFGYRNAIQQRSWGRDALPGGIVRVDLDAEADPENPSCRVVWHNDERAPSCVGKMAVETGLLYFYTFDERADPDGVLWYLTAIDGQTGVTRWKMPTGVGRNYDNNWGPVTLGPDGTAYVGVLQGIVAVYDGA